MHPPTEALIAESVDALETLKLKLALEEPRKDVDREIGWVRMRFQ